MADALFTDEEVSKAQQKALLNDPRVMTRMVAPDGTTFKALPQHVDALIAEGNKPFNPDSEWEVRPSPVSEFTMKVKARDLPDYIKQGYITNKLGEYERSLEEQQQYQQQLMSEVTPSALERTGSLISTAASGASMGATDFAGRMANELIGLASGDDSYAEDAARTLLDIKKSMPVASGIAELAGSLAPALATGGMTAGLTGGKLVAGMAAEGALGAVGSLAGQGIALGDEDITSQNYLWAAGLGAGLGGLAGGISNVLGKTAIRAANREIDDLVLDLGDLSPLKTGGPSNQVVPIVHNGEVVGKVELSRAMPDSYHPGNRASAVTIEGLQLADNAPRDTVINLMRDLTDEFGSVVSPSKLDALTDLRKDFSIMGVRKVTREGDEWFTVTPDTIPQNIAENSAALSFTKKVSQLTGQAPQKGSREFELFEKVYDPQSGIYRKGYLEFFDDPDKAIASLYKDFKGVQKMVSDQVRASETVRRELGDLVTKQGMIAMNNKIYQAQRKMRRSAAALDKIPTNDAATVAARLRGTATELDTVVANTDPAQAWRALLLKKKEMGAQLAQYEKAGMLTPEAISSYKQAYGGVRKALVSDKVLGSKGVEVLDAIDKAAKNSIDTGKAFMKEFGKRDINGKYQVDETKISQAYNAIRAGTRTSKLSLLDTFMADATDFANTIQKAKADGFLKTTAIPDTKSILPTLNKVNMYREFIETSRVINGMNKGTFITGMGQNISAMVGSLLGSALGGPLGSGIGAAALSALTRAASDPNLAIKIAQKANAGTDSLSNLISNMAKGGNAFVRRAAVPLSRVAILKALGVEPSKDNNKFVGNVRQRLQELGSPEALASIQGSTGNPMLDDQIAKTAKKAYAYTLDQLPKEGKLAKIGNVEAKKVEKLLLAAVNPQKALEKAVYEGDTDIAQHVQAMYPLPYQHFQKRVMEEIDTNKKMSYQTRIRLQKLTGLPYANTSSGAATLARAVFAKQAEEEKAPILLAPELTTGAAIQA